MADSEPSICCTCHASACATSFKLVIDVLLYGTLSLNSTRSDLAYMLTPIFFCLTFAMLGMLDNFGNPVSVVALKMCCLQTIVGEGSHDFWQGRPPSSPHDLLLLLCMAEMMLQ